MSKERENALKILLEPITWASDSSISSRKNLVYERRKEVLRVLPFLDQKESELAQEWLSSEEHLGLWE